MIVDCARDSRIFGLLLGSGLEYVCLYSGSLPVAMETAAPYLLRLESDDSATRGFLSSAWGHSWGIFLKCNTHIETIRRHLRTLLTVRDPDGNKLLFRYYDPRVFRPYLPTCLTEELQTLFGPVAKFWAEGETPDTIIEFTFDGMLLHQDQLPLTAPVSHTSARSQSTESPRRSNQLLTVRAQQLSALEQEEVRKFERWMVGHLQKFFPQQCSAMGDSQLRDFIQYGIRRASGYGIKAKRDVCKYVDVMLALGRDFDKDPRFPWAARLLVQSRVQADAVLQMAVSHLRHP